MTLQIELVAADRVVWSGEAREVIARTAEGDIGVLTGHAPLLSLLVPGVVEIFPVEGDTVRAAVSEGFISVAADRVSILSEDTFLADEVDESATTAELEKARSSEDDLAIRRAEAKLRLIGKAS
ncbi:MAG: F0F1 ATP synthase subunit epsilon [Aeromicrobium sp.]